jgi:pilus assembly protein CpaE
MTGAPILAVVSPKGGNGKTTICANLAASMARYSDPVVIDLDVHFGDVEYAFRLDPLYRLDDAVALVASDDDADITHVLTRHPTGVSALCAPSDPVAADRLDVDAVNRVVDYFIGLGRPVLLDTAGGISEFTLAAMDRATDYVIVCGTDVPSVQAARKLIDTMSRLGMDLTRIHLVINRSTSRSGLTPEYVEQAVGLRASLAVPEHMSLTAGMNQGCPVTESDPRSAIGQTFDRFVRTMIEVPDTDTLADRLRKLLP